METLKYLLALAVGAFLAGVGALTFLDTRIEDKLKPYVKTTEAQLEFSLKDDTKKLSDLLSGLQNGYQTIDPERERSVSKDQLGKLESNLWNALEKKIDKESDQLKGGWPDGKYVILANGECPDDFVNKSGEIIGFRLYNGDVNRLTEVVAGDSELAWHGTRGKSDLVELRLSFCVKMK